MGNQEARDKVGVIFPTGMIGAGFPAELVQRGIDLGAVAITIDGGSTDSGPYYLGSGIAKTSAPAVKRDLRIAMTAAIGAGIPLVVGSCGTAGTHEGVDWVAELARQVAAEEKLELKLARIYSDQSPDILAEAARDGRVHPLPPADSVDPEVFGSCEHVVGLMGHEPIVEALSQGANLVLAGRATDTALVAAIALMNGMPPGPAWHAAKTVECGGQCTVNPRAAGTSSPIYVEIDQSGFTVIPLHEEAACTPTSVAAHMLYENSNPFRLIEPSGVLDTSRATYTAIDPRVVRVEGSEFEEAEHPTVKLEGSRIAGYETISMAGIADPHILENLDLWMSDFSANLDRRVRDVLSPDDSEYIYDLRCYGYNAILGSRALPAGRPAEVLMLLKTRAATQATATAVAKLANPMMLHQPLKDMAAMPSFAFVTSPAETDRGPVYEFALNHVIDVSSGTELFRTEFEEIHA